MFWGDVIVMCWICSSIVKPFNFVPLSCRKGAGAERGCGGNIILLGDGTRADPGRAGAITTIGFAPLFTAEGDGLVMGLLNRRAKFCVLVRRTTWALSFDPGAIKEQKEQYGVLSSLKPKAFQTGKAQ